MKKVTFLLIALLVAMISYSQILVSENFNSATLPANWNNYQIGTGTALWEFGGQDMPTGTSFSSNAAIYNDDIAGATGLNDIPVLYYAGPSNIGLDVSSYSNLILTYEYSIQVFGSDGSQVLNVLIWDNSNDIWVPIRSYVADTAPTYDVINISNAINTIPGVDPTNFYFGFSFDDVTSSRGWGAGIDNVFFGEQVVNDWCSNTISVDVNDAGNGCTSPIIASNTLASDSSVANGTPTCAAFQGNDIWYSFVAPASGMIKVIVPTTGDWSSFSSAIYDTCSSTTALHCNWISGNGYNVYDNLTPGNTYYLRAWDYGNNDFGQIGFCIEEHFNEPAYSSCTVPLALDVGVNYDSQNIIVNFEGATASGISPEPSCGVFGSGEDIWFIAVVPSTGNITIETKEVPGSSFGDSVVVAYSGSCGSLTELGCDDTGGDGLYSKLELTGLTAGDILLIRVFEYSNNSQGEFEISAYDDSTASVSENEIEGLSLYPNPIKDILNINSQEEITKLSIYNQIGQLVKTVEPLQTSFNVDLSSLVAGVYVAKIESNDKISSKRLIKK